MSAIKRLKDATEYYETMKELHDLGLVSGEAVAKARREVYELRYANECAALYGGKPEHYYQPATATI